MATEKNQHLFGVYPCQVMTVGYGICEDSYVVLVTMVNCYNDELKLCFAVDTATDLGERLIRNARTAQEHENDNNKGQWN